MKSHALLIGISDYSEAKDRLKFAAASAQKLSDVLQEHYNFETITLLLDKDAQLERVLTELNQLSKLDSENAIFIAFFGHAKKMNDLWYFAPQDVDLDSSQHRSFLSEYELLMEYVHNYSASHLFLLLDTCFAGSILETRGVEANGVSSTSTVVETLMSSDSFSRFVFSAGRASDRVMDSGGNEASIFAEEICAALASANQAFISASSIASSVRDRVIDRLKYTCTDQQPVFNFIGKHTGGEFCFTKTVQATLDEGKDAEHKETSHSGNKSHTSYHENLFSKHFIGDYELLEPLGEGAQGKVWKAIRRSRNLQSQEAVALKVFRKRLDDNKVEALRELQHKNIVKIMESFVWMSTFDELTCVAMENLSGDNLESILRDLNEKRSSSRGFSINLARNYAVQCLDGLMAAYGKGVFHRDIKPSNLFITDDKVLKILDFDMERPPNGEDPTTCGAFMGPSYDYMAPEHLLGHVPEEDQASVIYSLGVVMFKLVSGTLPFSSFDSDPAGHWRLRYLAPSYKDLQQTDQSYELPRELLSSICDDDNWIDVVVRSLEFDRAKRYSTYEALLKDLQK